MDIFCGMPDKGIRKWIKNRYEELYGKPLTFTAEDPGAIVKMNAWRGIGEEPSVSLETSIDDGKSWQPFEIGKTEIVLENVGDQVMFRATKDAINYFCPSGMYGVSFNLNNGRVAASGNIQYIHTQSGQSKDISGYMGIYSRLFSSCKALTEAPELRAETLGNGSYFQMFANCTALRNGSKIFAKNFTQNCCYGMFQQCEQMTSIPDFQIDAVSEYSCKEMFRGCKMLQFAQPPKLNAASLAKECYNMMFIECEKLEIAPALPAKTLAERCYGNMFNGCTSLTQAPELPATALANYCYTNMFEDCTSLTQAPELPAKVAKVDCYSGMFSGCTLIDTAPTIEIVRTADYWCAWMFYNCKFPFTYSSKTYDEIVSMIQNDMLFGNYMWPDFTGVTTIEIICSDKTLLASYDEDTRKWTFEPAFEFPKGIQFIYKDGTVQEFNDVSGKIDASYFMDKGIRSNSSSDGYAWKVSPIEMVVGTNITTIGADAFSGMQSLEKVSIAESVTSIEDNAFILCVNLKDVLLPNGLKKIGYESFRDINIHVEMTIPVTVDEIGAGAFTSCTYGTITFAGRTLDQVKAMANYPWGAESSIIAELS